MIVSRVARFPEKPNHIISAVKKTKENKRQIQRKTKSIVKSLANSFKQSGNPDCECN